MSRHAHVKHTHICTCPTLHKTHTRARSHIPHTTHVQRSICVPRVYQRGWCRRESRRRRVSSSIFEWLPLQREIWSHHATHTTGHREAAGGTERRGAMPSSHISWHATRRRADAQCVHTCMQRAPVLESRTKQARRSEDGGRRMMHAPATAATCTRAHTHLYSRIHSPWHPGAGSVIALYSPQVP